MVESWKAKNEGYEHRLWTDDSISAFISEIYPQFLDLFDGYAQPICRTDLARYLILAHFGGVYADLDCRCLKPLAPLLDGRSFVIGLEPEAHLASPKVRARGLTRLPCPSFIASEPGHPLWEHVFGHLRAAAHHDDPLDATGPFLLAHALDDYRGGAPVTVVPPALLYPVDKDTCWSGRVHDVETWERLTRDAFMLHYWDGTWWRSQSDDGLPRQAGIRLARDDAPRVVHDPAARPRISCLMVTRDRTERARLAIESFRAQTYPDTELVIVTEAPDPALVAHVRALGAENVTLLHVRDPSPTLGDLRNIAVEHATGALVCQWDDDDLYDPRRLEIQYAALVQTGAEACMLERWLMWWPRQERLAVSRRRPWEGSLLCLKAAMPRYASTRRGEEAPVLDHLMRHARVALLDLPRLYTYVVHGANTFGSEHFEAHWPVATARYTGARYHAVIEELGRRLPFDRYSRASVPAAAKGTGSERVLVLTPVKDGRRHLDRYVELLGRLDHDPAQLSVAFLESDSGDGSRAALEALLPALRARHARAEVHHHDYGFRPEAPRWHPAIQRRRREILARARNRLLSRSLRDEDWVLWLDVDLEDYPPDLLKTLIGAGKDVVVPFCTLPDGRPFDLNTFRKAADGPEDPCHLRDGLMQPPAGEGRLYLDAFPPDAPVRVDGVGGTALLVRADLHREGLCFPPFPYGGYIETEGLAMMARDMGSDCWGLPGLRIVHSAT